MSPSPSSSYLHPDVECRRSTIADCGLIARARIGCGTLIIDYSGGAGVFLRGDALAQIEQTVGDYDVQVDDDLFFVPNRLEQIEAADFVNHSCEPTCGFRGSLQLVALRDINPGEEITFDYAMSESADYFLDCTCGTASCRKKISGQDWQRPELQVRYRGYFSPYLERKIAALSSAHRLIDFQSMSVIRSG